MHTTAVAPPRGKFEPLGSMGLEGVTIPDPVTVNGYLAEFPELTGVIPEVVTATREEFGPEAELSLSIYHDPEIDDRYVALYVRQRGSDPRFTDRIESVMRPFDGRLAITTGELLLAMDLRHS